LIWLAENIFGVLRVLRLSTPLFFFDGRTDEMFKAREKDRAVRAISNSMILKNIEILTTEDHRRGI
jgi:hypothetical protein